MKPNRIRELRRREGKTIRELAAALGVTETTLYRWQSGRNVPTIADAIRLADLLDSTPAELFQVELPAVPA